MGKEDVVLSAKKKAEKAYHHWQPIFEAARQDLYFQSDDEYAQWNQKDAVNRRRAGRPVLTIDQLAQFVNQVSNDIRMNTPSVNVFPYASGADEDTAEIFQGLIRKIEYNSHADEAYDNAVNFSIKASIGFIRVDHGYENDYSFNQELYVERVVNPFNILLDPDSVATDGSDAKYAFVMECVDMEKYKEEYPDASTVSFEIGDNLKSATEDQIIIAEYFYCDEQDATLVLDMDGTARPLEAGQDPQGRPTRKGKKKTVRRIKMNGENVLEESIFPGNYIPIVPVYGEEAWIDGNRQLYSLIRRSKDSQRMYNYWASMETELLQKAPKATFFAVEGTTEDYADDYLNPDKAGVLRYKPRDTEGNPANPPQIVPSPQIPAGIVNARQQATRDIRATMGLYDAFLGAQGNEISGVAIMQRQGEGDRAVFHFGDNLVRSINQVGRILVSAIPVVYDSPRIVRIMNKEGNEEEVGINGMYVDGQERVYSLAKGQYSVRVETGASYATMRKEASNFFQEVVRSQPQLMSLMGDLLFKYMDFPGAEALAERMRRTIDPAILDENSEDPAVVALTNQNQQLQQALQQLEQERQRLEQEMKDKQAEIEIKAFGERAGAESDARKHELELAKIRLEMRKTDAEIALKEQELELKAFEVGLKTSKEVRKSEKDDREEQLEVAQAIASLQPEVAQ